jgi:hypothetical protein
MHVNNSGPVGSTDRVDLFRDANSINQHLSIVGLACWVTLDRRRDPFPSSIAIQLITDRLQCRPIDLPARLLQSPDEEFSSL